MNTYASVAFIKSLLGISGTSKDVLLRTLSKGQKEVIDGMIGVTGMEARTITDERQTPYHGKLFFYVDEFNPSVPTQIKDRDGDEILASELAFMEVDDSPYSRKIHTRNTIGYSEFKVTYQCGYILDTTIQVTDFSALSGKYIQVGETVLNEGTEFDAVIDNATTAENIKVALGTAGNPSIRTGDIVTLGIPDDVATDSVNAITVIDATLPYDLRLAFSFLVGGAMKEKEGLGGIASYTLGTKTVNFRSNSEQNEFKKIMEKYVTRFKKISIISSC